MEHKKIKVQILLKKSQKVINRNRWRFTLQGEIKETTSRTVEYYAINQKAALNSFVQSEVDEVRIDGLLPVETVLDYKDLLVKALTNVNKAYLDAALEDVALYGVGVIDYQKIIDLCTETTTDLKHTILALEILKEKRA
ncbi:hypothetical protein LCGC14_0938330 [marine sediment metagenome]|uniref:Uncharacterized protein n=1 Tax=marine sediment metagenome TaxID=412755 RepID=A0A0F9NQH1_9ZZZZ